MNTEHGFSPSATLTAKQAAQYLNISESFLWDLRAKYEIPFVKVGSRTLWLRRDLEDWLKTHRVTSPEEESHLFDGRRSENKRRIRGPILGVTTSQNRFPGVTSGSKNGTGDEMLK